MNEPVEVRGKCHICQEQKWVSYCDLCRHFFCGDCRGKWFDRTVEFILEKFGGRKPGCCGPVLV